MYLWPYIKTNLLIMNKFITRLFTLSTLLILSIPAFSQTTVPALITSDQIWSISGSPYIINQNTYIDTNVSVTVMPGVEVLSQSDNYRLIIDGEFQALGKFDSTITIDKLQLDFNINATSYDASTGNGAFLNYCTVSNMGAGKRAIDFYGVSIKISNCTFQNTYYSIYGGGSNQITVDIENCTFYGQTYNYAIYTSAMNSKLNIINCTVEGGYGIYGYGDVVMQNCVFNGAERISLTSYDNIDVSCNLFKNSRYGVQLTNFATDSAKSLTFNYNTIDSAGSLSNPMLKIYKASGNHSFSSFEVNNNNFLTNLSNITKVYVYGTNSSPTSSELLDFESNYWGTTDSTTIESYITDYADDITIFGRANFANYLSSPDTNCSNGYNPCIAAFSYQISGDTVTFVDASYSAGSHTTNWTFGDGTSGSGATTTHIYTNTGEYYYVNLYIVDTSSNCSDSISMQIYVPFNSSCSASFYVAIDTSNSYNVFIINNSTGVSSNTNYYWTFGDGTGSTQQNPAHQYSAFGKHNLCLTIYDSLNACYSTYCDSVGIDSAGALLKTEGYTITVLNESDILSVNEPNMLNDFVVYPNPSNGIVHIRFNAVKNGTVDLSLQSYVGTIVYENTLPVYNGNTNIDLELNALSSGMYILNVKTEGEAKTFKLFINK